MLTVLRSLTAKRFMTIFLGLLLVIAVSLALLAVDDRRYPEYQVSAQRSESRKALLLTWEVSAESEPWRLFEESIFSQLKDWQDSGAVSLVIPLQHKPLRHPKHTSRWTHCALILLSTNASASAMGELILSVMRNHAGIETLRSVDVMRLQHGLDKFYPKFDGLQKEAQVRQVTEYVFSEPEHRQQYYEEQYDWSGPAMADLHSRDKVGRFIGFEVEQRLYGAAGMPAWDLFHVYGFTAWQTVKSVPFFFATWNKHAKRAFGPDMTFTKKLAEWDEIRLNVKGSAAQNMQLTLQQRPRT